MVKRKYVLCTHLTCSIQPVCNSVSDVVENADKTEPISVLWPCLLDLSEHLAENTGNQRVIISLYSNKIY